MYNDGDFFLTNNSTMNMNMCTGGLFVHRLVPVGCPKHRKPAHRAEGAKGLRADRLDSNPSLLLTCRCF